MYSYTSSKRDLQKDKLGTPLKIKYRSRIYKPHILVFRPKIGLILSRDPFLGSFNVSFIYFYLFSSTLAGGRKHQALSLLVARPPMRAEIGRRQACSSVFDLC